MSEIAVSSLTGYDRAAIRALLGDFTWLLDQHPEHKNEYSGWRIEQIERLLGEAKDE